MHRIRQGQKWRIAKSAWAGIRPDEELHLVATPILDLASDSHDSETQQKQLKDEPKPKPSPLSNNKTSPRVARPQQPAPISPQSLANSISSERRSFTGASGAMSDRRDVAIPATPDDSTVSDTEDEALPLGVAEGRSMHPLGDAANVDAEVPDSVGSTPSDTRSQSAHTLSVPDEKVVPPPPSSTPRTSTQSSTEDDVRQTRRSPSPSPSHQSTKSRVFRQHGAFSSPTDPVAVSDESSCSPSNVKLAPPTSSAASVSNIVDQFGNAFASSSAFPPPAQQPPASRTTEGPVTATVSSSQPSNDSETSWRIGIDSTGQVNFVPASSPRVTCREIAPTLAPPLAPETSQPIEEEDDEEKEAEEEAPIRKLDKGKGRAIYDHHDEGIDGDSDELEVVVRSSPKVKKEAHSSPLRSNNSVAAASKRRTSQSPRNAPSFAVEVPSPSPKKRQGICRIAPRKKRRLSQSTATPTSTREPSSSSTNAASSTVDPVASSIDMDRPSADTLACPSTSRLAATCTDRARPLSCACQQDLNTPTASQHALSTSTLEPPRKKSRASVTQRQRQRKHEDDVAAALARPRVEIPRYPRSGRFCLYLRLPNVPVAPKWHDAQLRPSFLLKYQGNGSSATLGNVLSHVFEYVSIETGWSVRDLRLRYTDRSQPAHPSSQSSSVRMGDNSDHEDEGAGHDEREKSAWGFDTFLTDFQNLEEWGVGTQDFLEVDFIPFSPNRTWMDRE